MLLNRFLMDRGFGSLIPPVVSGGIDAGPAGSLPLPFILKKRTETFGRGSHNILTPDDNRRYQAEIRSPDYFCQALIPGPIEYSLHIYFKSGQIVTHLGVAYHFDTDTPIKGQTAPTELPLYPELFLPLWHDVLTAINYQGLCNINYKLHNGRPQLLEINPRFGGSLSEYFFAMLRHI